MRSIEILDGGLFTTVQDLGRIGFQRFGVAVSGAMDAFAHRAANRLVGNPDAAASLEMTLVGPELRFTQAASIAVAGADLGACVDGRPLPMWRTIAIRAGSVLSFPRQRDGMRAYLAVDGGIDVPIVLGSRSTSTRSGLGGFEGRALRAGDVLPLGELRSRAGLSVSAACATATPRPGAAGEGGEPGSPGPALSRAPVVRRALGRSATPSYGHQHRVRVVWGPQDDAFSDEGRATFVTAEYTITPQSDRIGCRLAGPPVAHRSSADIVSDGTSLGIVQVSGDGCPIVLMADRGTTGGYTKIAAVISADLWRIAQAAPGDRVRFEAVDLDEACARAREQEAVLDAIIAPPPAGPPGAPAGDVYDEDAGSEMAAEGSVGLADALDETGWGRDR